VNVGTKIKAGRLNAGLTQDELAARLFVSRQLRYGDNELWSRRT